MYKTLRLSTIALVRNVIDQFPNTGIPIQYMDWDAHANVQELPDADLIGLIGFAVTQDEAFHDVTFGVGVVTLNDNYIMRLTDYVDTFYTRFAPMAEFPTFDPTTGLRIGKIVIFEGTSVTPIMRAEVRPAVSLQVSGRFVADAVGA